MKHQMYTGFRKRSKQIRAQLEYYDQHSRQRLERFSKDPASLVVDENALSGERAFAPLTSLITNHGHKELTVVDVGCGEGKWSAIMAKLGLRVIGVDLSPTTLEIARLRARINGVSDWTQFLVGSADEMNFSALNPDLVTGFAVLHHLNDAMCGALLAKVDEALSGRGMSFWLEPIQVPWLVPVMHLIPRAPHWKGYYRPSILNRQAYRGWQEREIQTGERVFTMRSLTQLFEGLTFERRPCQGILDRFDTIILNETLQRFFHTLDTLAFTVVPPLKALARDLFVSVSH